MLSAKLLRHIDEDQQGRFARAAGRVIDGLIAQYAKALRVGPAAPAADPAGGHRHPALTAPPAWPCPGASSRCRTHGVIQGVARRRSRSPSRPCPSASAPGCRGGALGPGGGQPVLLHRRRRQQPDPQHRPPADQPQAAQRARRHRQRSDPAPAARTRPPARDRAVHAAGAGPDHRGPGRPHPVPVHLAGRRPDVLAEWVPKLVGAAAGAAVLADVASDWQDKGLAGLPEHRSRHRPRLGVKLWTSITCSTTPSASG
ncbi:hypothetical protein ACPA9J_02325 [Pseudomonas aeruginosa]